MPTSNPAKPLDGFRVLDFTQNVAGPLAGQVLVDLGAEVIKVEAPGGEAARQITSVLPGRPPLATYFLPNNRGKKSVTVDLTTEQAKQQMLRLADTADVVLEAFRPGTMEKLGLGPDDLRSRNPNLIYARLTAYGGNGPHGSRPGIDLVVAAEAGMTTGMPTPEGKPQIIPFQLVDNASGHMLAQAVLAALLHRERNGVADVVQVAMYDVAVGLQANQLMMHLNRAASDQPKPEPAPKAKRRKGVGFATQPSDAFRTADGYIVISAYVPKHWQKLCYLIGRPDLVEDQRFAEQRSRSINYAELTAELELALASQDRHRMGPVAAGKRPHGLPRPYLETGRRHPPFRRERPHPGSRSRGGHHHGDPHTGALRQLPRGRHRSPAHRRRTQCRVSGPALTL